MEIKFKRDTSFRKQFFVPDSFAHPAKMDAQLLIWIVERYTGAGETILDPMAGSGTMMLACGLGRNVILVELEEKFCKMMRDNWAEVRMRPQLGSEMGLCDIKQGDARDLVGLFAGLIPPERRLPQQVDKCIFSPPYAERHSYPDAERERLAVEKLKAHPDSQIGGSRIHEHCSENPDNIGNLPYGSIDKIVTSPPYAESNTTGQPDTYTGSHGPHSQVQLSDYRQSKDNLGNLPYGNIDAVVTSPPYEGIIQGEAKSVEKQLEKNKTIKFKGNYTTPGRLASHARLESGYSGSIDNIGNLKSSSYLEAMLQVYAQCHSVLKEGGLMILVTKNFIRNKQVIRLDTDTRKLCEQAGFTYLERHYRKLSSQSFWRVIYHQKHPEVEQILYEDVLVFRNVKELKV